MANFLIAGGHQGTVGAVGNSVQEEAVAKTLSDKIVKVLIEQGHQAEEPNYNLWDKVNENLNISTDLRVYNYILEVHLDAFNGTARGSSILVSSQKSDRTVENAILNRLSKHFANRGIKERDDLQNIVALTKAGRNNSLVEVCFIDNLADMKILLGNMDEIAKDIAYGILEGLNIPIKVIQTISDVEKDIIAPDYYYFRVVANSFKSRNEAYAKVDELKSKGIGSFVAYTNTPTKK